MGFCSLRFDLQKTEYTELYGAKNACFARILTYCATHAPAQPFATKERYGCGVPLAGIPYLCTPTGVSCLSSELFRSLSACRKGFFDTLGSPFGGAGAKRLRGSSLRIIEWLTEISIRAGGTPPLFTIHCSPFTVHLIILPAPRRVAIPARKVLTRQRFAGIILYRNIYGALI